MGMPRYVFLGSCNMCFALSHGLWMLPCVPINWIAIQSKWHLGVVVVPVCVYVNNQGTSLIALNMVTNTRWICIHIPPDHAIQIKGVLSSLCQCGPKTRSFKGPRDLKKVKHRWFTVILFQDVAYFMQFLYRSCSFIEFRVTTWKQDDQSYIMTRMQYALIIQFLDQSDANFHCWVRSRIMSRLAPN